MLAYKETVLLVDDEPEDLMKMRQALENDGYRVLDAADFGQALSVAKQNRKKIDILVTDISLPGPNGCELAKYLLQSQPDLKLLFVSGHCGAEICRYYGIPVGGKHFMRKPISLTEFVIRIRELLDSEERFQLSTDSGAEPTIQQSTGT